MPMVMITKPNFFDSEWIYVKPQGGYAIKPNAPEKIKKEFREFQGALECRLERTHGLDAVISQDSVVLILGTLPGQTSLAQGKYYADPSNKFWRILFGACGEKADKSVEAKAMLLNKYRIALWDVLESAVRKSGGDDTFEDEEPNNLPKLLAEYPNIKLILFHSQKAYKYFRKFYKNTAIPYVVVSSPSGQNRKNIDDKICEWRGALSTVIPQLQTEHRLEWK